MTTASAPANANDVAMPFPIPLLPPAQVSFGVGGSVGRTCYDDSSAFCDAFHALAGVNGIVDVMATGFGETSTLTGAQKGGGTLESTLL